MRRIGLLAFLASCLAGLAAYAVTSTGTIHVTVVAPTQVMPGPNAALFAAPYYTCTRSFFVATTGNDANAGTSASPWGPTPFGHSTDRVAGDCIILKNGTYAATGASLGLLSGGLSHPNGYLVFKAQNLGGAILKTPAVGRTLANMITFATSYVIVDGIEFDGSSHDYGLNTTVGGNNVDCNMAPNCPGLNGQCFTLANDFVGHIKILNSKIHNCGNGGIALAASAAGGGDYFEVAYNDIYNNVYYVGTSESGLSVYVPNRDNAGCNGDDAMCGTSVGPPYRIWFHHNKAHDNHCSIGPCFDGNGIIVDHAGDADRTHQSAQNGAGYTLPIGIEYNWTYNNGGGGIQLTASPQVVMNHNSLYNDRLDISTGCPATAMEYQGTPFMNSAYPVGPVATNNAIYVIPRNCGGGVLTACVHWDGFGIAESPITNNSTFTGTAGQNCIGQGSSTPIMPTGQTPPNKIGVNPGFVSVTPGSENLCIAAGSAIFGLGIGAC